MVQGKNLVLRALEKEDLARARDWVNDPQIARFMLRSLPVTMAQQEKWFEALIKDPSKVVFAIERIEGGRHIGNAGLYEIDRVHRKAKFWILIGDKESWGTGSGTEAARLLLEYAFDHLDLEKVWLEVDMENPRAMGCYEKAGFQKEGVLRSEVFIAGKRRDLARMAVLAPEFQAGRSR